jgi:hypothetical protein
MSSVESQSAAPASQPAFFHEESDAVRFWVLVEQSTVGASIGRVTLHYRFRPYARDDDPLETYNAHSQEIDAAVRRRVANGSIEPVMLREYDLHDVPASQAVAVVPNAT